MTYPSLSLIIPAWSGTQALADMLLELCEKVKPMCDELIVCEDSGNSSQIIDRIADKYLRHRWTLGDIRSSVLGMWMASGDYIGLLNTDIVIHKGNLRDLCVPGGIGSPVRVYGPSGGGNLMDFCFVIDTKLLRELGYMDTSLKVGPDWNFLQQAEKFTTVVPSVEVQHIGGVSYSQMKIEGQREASLVQRREIDPQRHKERTETEPAYAKLWGNEEGTEG